MGRSSEFRAWWFQEALRQEDAPPRPRLSGERTADVCVVGGGYTGLWTAIMLAQDNPTLDIVVVEQGLCGHGASGSNGGCMLTLSTKYLSLMEFYGESEARRLVRASERAVHEIHEFTRLHGIECDMRIDGALYMASNESQVGRMASVLTALERTSLNSWSELPLDRARRMAGTRGLFEGLHSPDGGSVQPALLVRGLARVAEELGVSIHENSPMQRLERGERPAVVTAAGQVRARKVVLAVNAWMPELFPEFARSIAVVSSDMGITEPCPERLERLGLTHGASVCDSRVFVHYYHTTSDGRLLLGKGGNTFSYGSRMIPSFFEPSRYEWQIRQGIDRFFPELEGVRLEQCWNGGSDRSKTGFPFFGQLDGSPNVLYGFGYSGNGVVQSYLGGKILSSLALDRDDEWSRSGFVGGPRGLFPPEPVRWLGAHMVRNGIRRLEAAEDAGRRPGAMDRYLATFAKGAGKSDN
jgi:putative aminophosphonate oxidoreductase